MASAPGGPTLTDNSTAAEPFEVKATKALIKVTENMVKKMVENDWRGRQVYEGKNIPLEVIKAIAAIILVVLGIYLISSTAGKLLLVAGFWTMYKVDKIARGTNHLIEALKILGNVDDLDKLNFFEKSPLKTLKLSKFNLNLMTHDIMAIRKPNSKIIRAVAIKHVDPDTQKIKVKVFDFHNLLSLTKSNIPDNTPGYDYTLEIANKMTGKEGKFFEKLLLPTPPS